MAGLTDLVARSIGSPNKFNWPWFIELCVCGIIVLFFLFYFNRLFATLLSYGFRAYAWHHYRVWVDIQALQISLLGGRIFFKGVRYHGENETIYVHNGYITWRYWFRNVQHVDLTTNDKLAEDDESTQSPDGETAERHESFTNLDEEGGAARKQNNSEARIAIFVTGFEWFIYNRTPLYDAILRNDPSHTVETEESPDSSTGIASSEALKVHLRSKFRKRQKSSDTSSSDESKSKVTNMGRVSYNDDDTPRPLDTRSTATTEVESAETDVTAIQALLIQILPIYIECSRAAISIGNEHTRAILVTTLDKAKGHVNARGCGPNDLFRQLFEFDVEHPIVQMRPNPDFVGTQNAVAEYSITESYPLGKKERWWRPNLHMRRRKDNAVHALRNLVPGLQSSVASLHHKRKRTLERVSYLPFGDTDADGEDWHGLSRYLDENDADDHAAWAHIDYARFSTMLDCPSVHMTFYWDSPGRVKADHMTPEQANMPQDINGVSAPAYGLDLIVRGGNVNYGPWTDRLRAEIQSVFFPASYKSAVPAKKLGIGQWRQSTAMIIKVDIEEEVNLRVPTRESSKDWRWRGRATAVRDAAAMRKQNEKRHFRLRRGTKNAIGLDIRPFGWISVSVSPDSTVRYEMDMVANSDGYRNQLYLDLKGTKATSSVNHAELWHCASHKLKCDLSNPLEWNSQHTWQFNIDSQSMDMFLLRDHMFLLTDLIADFTAGPKSNYMTFIPFEYRIGLQFQGLKLFLNANDFNIIDNPCDLESNAFLILGLQELKGTVNIPMRYFAASQNSVLFQAHGSDLFLDLKTPVWNTLHSFANDENMLSLKKMQLGGSYNYNTDNSPQATDSLFMDIVGGSPKFRLQGFLIRYFMNVKENYFGEDLHFRTLEEYQSRVGPDNKLRTDNQKRPAKNDNDLDVILNIRAEDSCALMPTNIYTREENLRVDVMLVEADMRFTNYYMDLQVNSSPIEVSTENESMVQGQTKKDTTNTQLYISTVGAYGHRLFGAPPTEPTYVCNWDFDVGSINGECSTQFLRVAISAIKAFIFTFDDEENKLPVTRETSLNDITFLRAKVGTIDIGVLTDMAAFLLRVASVTVQFDDWAGQNFSKSLKASVPSVMMAAVESQGSFRRPDKFKHHTPTLACLETSVYIVNIDKKAEFEHQRQLQQDHVKFHDLRTHRAQCLLHDQKPLNIPAKEIHWSQNPPAMPVPELPTPISAFAQPSRVRSRLYSKYTQRPNSFLSSKSTISLHQEDISLHSGADKLSRANNADMFDVYGRFAPKNTNKSSGDSSGPTEKSNRSQVKDVSFSSPWIEPRYLLRTVQPDLSQMPDIDLSVEGNNSRQAKDPGAEQDYTDSDEPLPHAAIFCNLPCGLRAFCSPLLFPAIVHLLQGVEPQDPVSLLDAIQQSTTASIKSLTTESLGEKVDFAVRLPAAAVRLVNTKSKSTNVTDSFADQYDLVMTQVRLNGRTAPTVTKRTHGQTKQDILLLQASVRGLDVTIAETMGVNSSDIARLNTSIRDVEFWLSLQDEIRTKLQIGSLQVSTGGSTVDRLSMLAERSRIMITKMIADLEALDQAYAAQHLAYHLSAMQARTTDPVFLLKPSYVLRSAAEHIRATDSWKIVARFRQRLLSLPPGERTMLLEHTNCTFDQEQESAKEQALEWINQWKTLERQQEACKPVITAIFGSSVETNGSLSRIANVEVGVYMGQISVVLDPGPQQSELLLQSGDLNFSQKPLFDHDSTRVPQGRARGSKMRAQLWFAEMALDLNWNLIELARSLVKQINITSAMAEKPRRRSSAPPRPSSTDFDLVVVVGTDLAAAKIQTINLNVYMAAKDLKSSAAVYRAGSTSTSSVLVAAYSAQMKLASQSRKLLNWNLQSPTVYGQYQQNPYSLKESDTARFAASCNRLRFSMKEDILSLLEVVHRVVKDEAMVINEVVNSIEQQTSVAKPRSRSTTLKLEDIHVALFLHNYRLRFCLLPSLHYSIVGTVARTSIVPLPTSSYAVHVDIKRNKHIFIEPNRARHNPAATLEIPPISGRLLIGVSNDRVNVNARTTLERISVDADAVQACIQAAYQPHNVQHLKEAKLLVKRIKASVKRLKDPSAQRRSMIQTTQEPQRTILYSGIAVLEGFDIHCSAPSTRDSSYRADLKLGLQATTLRIHNHRKARTIALSQPQFEVKVRQIFVGLYEKKGSVTRNYGRFGMGLKLKSTTHVDRDGDQTQKYRIISESTNLDLYAETAPLVIDMATFLQGRITEMTTEEDRKKIPQLRRLTLANNDDKTLLATSQDDLKETTSSSNVFDITFALDLNAIQVRWIVNTDSQSASGRLPEDLVFSIRQVELRTQRESSARLTILDTQLQTVPKTQADPTVRTSNSALLPEMIFNAAHFSTKRDRRFAFQAAGKALDLRLAADGILPLSTLQKSLARAAADLRNAKAVQTASDEPEGTPVTSFLGNKRLASLLIDADFAGAVVKISPRVEREPDSQTSAFGLLKGPKRSKAGRYGQAVQSDGAQEATLRAPGIAVKVEYLDNSETEPTLSTEVKVAGSSNTLAPSVVPLILEIYSSVKEIIGEDSTNEDSKDSKAEIMVPAQKYLSDAAQTDTDPTAILGRVRLNAGLWVQRQEFSLTCQPIARVSATARFEEIFVTINTVQGGEQERFFSIIVTFNKLQTSVQHVYSRESTASFEVESIVMSLMNSKHVSTKNGISAILNISPMRASLNAKQMQDFLLFREIWYPAELRQRSTPPTPAPNASESHAYAMQRYQELAANAALPWHAIVSIHELKLDIDFGQALGKSSFMISKLWASSKKNSDWEQNLCIGFDRVGVDSSGRMSGFIELKEFRARTSIRWPVTKDSGVRAPLVQASIGFGHLRLKIAFDYQPFAIADISSFEFLMYNIRPTRTGDSDRLVGILNGGKVQVFCTSAAAAQALSIVQAFERLIQEKRDAFQDSLHELDSLLRRKSLFPTISNTTNTTRALESKGTGPKRESHRLHTDVVVTLKAIDIGAFPSTFFDNQILKIEAVDVQARFSVAAVDKSLRSGLGMTLGQVRVALSTVGRTNTKALSEVEISEVIDRATSSRGGTILKVPRLVASMQTWQQVNSNQVEYIFKSTFQGKVDVGWNYSRIRFIRGMWETHSQALAHRLGKPLPPAAVKITAEPQGDGTQGSRQEKITAVVNVPQSTKFQYVALEPPIIDTPQLRDMGEATPPLEWIGLHRDKLPNVTHSIVIVTLIEVAKEVEDAYTRILGTG